MHLRLVWSCQHYQKQEIIRANLRTVEFLYLKCFFYKIWVMTSLSAPVQCNKCYVRTLRRSLLRSLLSHLRPATFQAYYQWRQIWMFFEIWDFDIWSCKSDSKCKLRWKIWTFEQIQNSIPTFECKEMIDNDVIVSRISRDLLNNNPMTNSIIKYDLRYQDWIRFVLVFWN